MDIELPVQVSVSVLKQICTKRLGGTKSGSVALLPNLFQSEVPNAGSVAA
jgi:hypothetical protein